MTFQADVEKNGGERPALILAKEWKARMEYFFTLFQAGENLNAPEVQRTKNAGYKETKDFVDLVNGLPAKSPTWEYVQKIRGIFVLGQGVKRPRADAAVSSAPASPPTGSSSSRAVASSSASAPSSGSL